MHHLRFVVFLLLVGLTLPLTAGAALTGGARITLMEGEVQLRGEGETEWLPAAVNTPLMEGDSVWCPAGARAEMQAGNGSLIRLDGRSSIDIVTLEEDFGQFHVAMGHIYVLTGKMRDRSLQFDVEDASVKVYEKSRFRIDVDDDGGEDIAIFKGTVQVESGGTKTRVRTGETLSVEEGRTEIFPLSPPDAWERWNRDRDRRVTERRAESRYLPEELEPYAADLEGSGRWTNVPEYGTVWQPTAVPPDWAPYREGRWVWRGGDYVWISYEPWGWAPYHYGRWFFSPAAGWCWVPPVAGNIFWSPGYVGWVITPAYVGWVPLAPGEIYYGRGYYGPSSVNITQVNITNNVTVTKNVYRNTVVTNGLAIMPRESFVAGRTTYVRPTEKVETLLRQRVLPTPSLPPASREARMPQIRAVAPAHLPPPAVQRVVVKELRERHPRIAERRQPIPAAGQGPVGDKGSNRTGRPEREQERTAGAPPRGGERLERERGQETKQVKVPPGQVKKLQGPKKVWKVRPADERKEKRDEPGGR